MQHGQSRVSFWPTLQCVHELTTRQRMTTLPRYIDYICLETLTSKTMEEPSPVIFGVSRAVDILAQILAFLMASMWSGNAWTQRLVCSRANSIKGSDFSFFFTMFSSLLRTSWNAGLHIRPRDSGACTITKKREVYASALWNCADGITTWSDLSACVRELRTDRRQLRGWMETGQHKLMGTENFSGCRYGYGCGCAWKETRLPEPIEHPSIIIIYISLAPGTWAPTLPF